MRFVDIMLCFPTLFLILAVIAIVGPSIWVIMIVIGITSWMDVSRLVRAEILTLKERDFVAAAKAIGAGDVRIIFRHILPNALSPVFVSATLGIAGAILLESGLSFLGLGVQPPDASWGNILTSGKDYITTGAWWLSFFPGIAILITVLSYNLVGEGLRDALDPRLWRSGK
jgi:peptide/nickel transport system permease protein